ncbi:MAG: DsbA family protein [Qingshengfaniella sp.]
MTQTFRGIRAGLLSAALFVAAPLAALDLDKLSDTERQAFRDEIRSYLLDNPEVLIEAFTILEQRQVHAQAQADGELVTAYAEDIFSDGRSWVGGNPEGDLTLVEFVDYRCTYCRQASDEVHQLVAEDGNIRFIVKELPVLGEDSVTAARFAIATRTVLGAEAYEKVNTRLMKLSGQINEASLRRLSREAGLDVDPILTAMEDPAISEELLANRTLAQAMGISGTPTFILGQDMLRGYLPPPQMQQMVAAARAAN